MPVPRRQVQGRVPGLVLASQDSLPAVLGQLDEDRDGPGVPRPRRAVQRRVQRRVPAREEALLPEPDVELPDQLVVPLLGSHVKNGVPLRSHLKYVTLSMLNNA